MKKILLKRIITVFLVIGILIIALFSIIIPAKSKNEAISDMQEMLGEVKISYQNSLKITEEKIEMYEKDYLSRAHTIDFILKNYPDLRNMSSLQEIKKLIEVESINVIDKSGEVVLSSEAEAIGLNFLEYEESKEFWNLIRSKEKGGEVVDLDAVSIYDGKLKDFIGVKSECEEYSVIQIGVDRSVLNKIKSENSITKVLENMPTVAAKSVFAVDSSSGDLKGATQNNKQEVKLNGVNSKEEYIKRLKQAENGKLLKVNDQYNLVLTETVDDVILVLCYQIDSIVFDIFVQLLNLVLTIVSIFIVLMVILDRFISKYVLRDFISIENDVKELMAGNYDIQFTVKENTELKSLTRILNDWKDSYKHKSQRMSRIITSLDSHIAVFECLYYINQNFFSDNVQSILGMDDDEWNKISHVPFEFENYLSSLPINENGIVSVNDRFVKIKSFKISNEFYGIITDKTEEININKEIINELKEVRLASERDTLTNLVNRKGFEKYVKESLLKYPGQGMMIIFDLDNFKSINDALGHPEGDKVLKMLGECLTECFRESDIIARFGGDEFIVFIGTNLSLEMVDNKMKNVLGNIRKKLQYYYSEYHVSTSIGVAYVDNKINTFENLYKCADTALYIAKKSGKDNYHINEDNIRCTRGE